MMSRIRLVLVALLLSLPGCTALRPAVQALDAVCTLGLVDSPAVQASAADRGIPIAELAALLCSVPAVYAAWEQAHEQRQDPVAAAVREARARGLL